MKYLRLPALILLLLPAAPAIAQSRPEPVVEHTSFGMEIAGEKVIVTVDHFSDSPEKDPAFLQQLNSGAIDHVVFLEEARDPQGREPSQIDEYDELKARVQQNSKPPVVVVRAKKGFFKLWRENWKAAFGKVDPNDPIAVEGERDSVQKGLISVASKSGLSSVLLVTKGLSAFRAGAGLVLTQGIFGYLNNRYTAGIKQFTNTSLFQEGAAATFAQFAALNTFYNYLVAEAYKFSQLGPAAMTADTQFVVLSNVVYTLGRLPLSSLIDKKFRGQVPKINLISMWTNTFSELLIQLDLIRHPWMFKLFQVDAFEFRLSGAILIGYYVGTYFWAKKNTEGFYNAIAKGQKGLLWVLDKVAMPLVPVGKWLTARFADCKQIFSKGPGAGDPPSNALPE